MSFKISRNSMAGRAPDLVDDIPAGTAFAGTLASIVAGKAVTITAGKLVQSVTGDAVAGYLTVETPITNGTVVDYGGGVNSTFPDGVVDGVTGLLFQPVSRINPVFADVTTLEETAGATLPGTVLDIDANGLGVIGEKDIPDGSDFRVTKIVARDSAGKAVKVEGFFLSTGYFA